MRGSSHYTSALEFATQTFNTMHTYFISDLHLTPERPKTIQAFAQFMQTQAMGAERLYILGDLFEYWIGDDAASMLGAEPALEIMKQVSQSVECYFIAGNRDFLVRDGFSQKSGFTVLPDETVIDLYGTPTLILHGDSLCTDDTKHQEFRASMMTNTTFCDEFLSQPIPARIELAKQARMQSGEHKQMTAHRIMDVTPSAVLDAFAKNGVSQMIHGHTHRQNTHKHSAGTRYVLGDWDQTSSVMTADPSGIRIDNQPI